MRDRDLPRLRPRARRRRSPYPLLTIAVAVVGIGIIAWMLTWGAPEEPRVETATPSVAVAAEPERTPTPRFAEVGSVDLHLPIDPSAITALAFHQASGQRAQSMTALVPDVPDSSAIDPEALATQMAEAADSSDVWGGVCLRLWRSGRGGMPDTAADIGAEPGTDVYAPVTGTVVEVRPYLLYEKHEDIEIHIQPDGADGLDVVLIHVTDASVEAGDRVIGGVTRIAAIRKMSGLIELQLAGYTGDGGDHVHMQVNTAAEPGELDDAGGS
ncbi:MAG: M23 family metallopeptidase [Coriobacteriia bacterium]